MKNPNRDAYAEIGLLVTPENIAAWERVLPTMSQADREPLAGMIAEMKARGRWLREHARDGLARTA